jgi:hypothetical protein
MRHLIDLAILLSFGANVLAIGLWLAKKEDAQIKPNIKIIHPVESIRCVSQDSKIVFCESFRDSL